MEPGAEVELLELLPREAEGSELGLAADSGRPRRAAEERLLPEIVAGAERCDHLLGRRTGKRLDLWCDAPMTEAYRIPIQSFQLSSSIPNNTETQTDRSFNMIEYRL